MKKWILLNGLFLFSLAASSQTKNFIDQPYIEVNGTADSLVTPNEIFIKIIVSEKDTRDRVSLEEQESKMIAALKGIGIPTSTDLTVTEMVSNFKTYLLKQKDILKTREYMLKVSDAATTGKVFLKLEEIGISNCSIERVDHSGLEQIRNACRSKAIENAKVKAQSLTKPLGQAVGNAIFISDNESNFDGIYQGRVAGMQLKTSAMADNYVDPGIDFEKIKVKINVNVRFMLK
jgi:uncharacterized protein YggE